jgi:TolB-like protein/DNA-binding winged helix-turn-helix (wHTH) protein/Tfp pilus assembly protein PilF
MPEASTVVRLRFGVFEVDLRAGELRKHGVKIRLQEQPFQVLAMLIQRPGEIVTREELRTRLWSADTFVDFDHGVNKAINRIRDAIGDSATSPRFIETVARRGYRFIGHVTAVEQTSVSPRETRVDTPPGFAAEHTAEHIKRPPERGAAHSWRIWSVAGVAVAIAFAVVLAVRLRSGRPIAPIHSLAVLPLENVSGDVSQEYFADGMTDELITTLGQISALRVISRTSAMLYKGARKPLAQIARELDVDAVVDGAVFRSGNQVRITAEIIDARNDTHLWSHSFSGELRDALALQQTVARAIADQISRTVNSHQRAVLRQSAVVDPQAYEAYLKGRYFWNKRTGDDFRKASEYFNQAIARDPTYAPAYSGLADTYALMGDWEYGVLAPREALPRGKDAAIKAIALDDALGEAHTSLAFLLDAFDWDLPAADREFRRAIALNPGYATAHHWYAWHLSLLGRNDEAITEMKRARRLDPLSLIINADFAELLLIAHHVAESIQQSRKTLEMDANFSLAHNQLGVAYLASHQPAEAVAELQRAVRLSEGSATCTANLAWALAESGARSDAVRVLEELKERSRSGYSNASEIAIVYAALSDNGRAMAWLERAYNERFNPSVLLRPGFDSLRDDARFKDLEHRVGLAH